jgi:protein translocase SecG subunit
MEVLKYLMYGLHAIISLGLIALVVAQTSKSEGLGAAVGGGSGGGSVRGRAGVDEQLAQYTRYVAVAFMIMSALLYMLATKFGWV